MDSSIEKHESMNPHDLSFTCLGSESSLSDPKYPVLADTAPLMQQDQLDSAVLDELTAHTEFDQNSFTEKHESMNPQHLSFLQIDSKFNISDPISPVLADTGSLMQQDQMDHAVYGEFNAPTKFHQNSFTEKHESMNPPDLISTQTNSSDPTCSVPIETVSFIQQGQGEVVHTEFHQLCLPRKPRKVPTVSFLFVSNTYKLADLTFHKPKSRDETSRDQTPLPPISCQKETPFYMPKSRDETLGDRIPLPPIPRPKETALCLMTVLGPVCAALFAAYWGWSCFNASENPLDN